MAQAIVCQAPLPRPPTRVTYAGVAARGSVGGSRRVLPERSSASLRALLREDTTASRQIATSAQPPSAGERVLRGVLAVLCRAVGRVAHRRRRAQPRPVGRGGVLVRV